jgi:DnaJ family protein C protein 28
VEDMIQESIKRGDFNNLAGQGRPLQYSAHNPFVDIHTHNINKILVNNGFAPEWIMLQSEIRFGFLPPNFFSFYFYVVLKHAF